VIVHVGCLTVWCPVLSSVEICTWHAFFNSLLISPAVEEAIIALVRLHQKYTFMLSDKLMTQPLELKQGITISPKGGLPVTVVSRASKQSGVAAGP